MNKRIRKKQIRRAAARQGGGEKGIRQHLVSSSDYKRPIIERWGEYAELFRKHGVEPDFSSNRIVTTGCKMSQIRNLEK